MTEEVWVSIEDPAPLLKWLQKSKRHRPSRRKVQLFANACTDRVKELMIDNWSRRVLQLADQLAEVPTTEAEFRAIESELYAEYSTDGHQYIAGWTLSVASLAGAPETAARHLTGYVAQAAGTAEPPAQAALLRDIIGSPYHPVAFDPYWRTSTAVGLARSIYESRGFDRMPILADALQDAGCDEPTILDHCRGDGPHVRGCWVVDLVLSKT